MKTQVIESAATEFIRAEVAPQAVVIPPILGGGAFVVHAAESHSFKDAFGACAYCVQIGALAPIVQGSDGERRMVYQLIEWIDRAGAAAVRAHCIAAMK